MSTVSNVLSFARAQCQTDSNGLTDANGVIFTNEALVDFHRKLVNSSIDASQIQEAYRDAIVPVAGNGSTFLYPEDAMFLKAIEVNYAGTDPNGYLKAEQVDHANLAGDTSFSWLRQNQSTNAPKFADNGDWYEIFPAFKAGDNLSQAIRIIYFMKPTEYSATTDTIAYPASLDYRILGWRVASNYYYSLNKFVEGDAFNARYEERVKQLIGTLGRGTQQPIQVGVLQIGDNGWAF
jgi:hypothetical protein